MAAPLPSPVHPDVQKILEARPARDFSTVTVDEARAAHRAGATAGPPGPDMADVVDTELAGVAVRRYEPADSSGGTAVYFHGGGWVLGSLDTHDRQCRQLAAGSGAAVISVDYRLAPEHPFPAAFDDAVAVTEAVLAGGLGADTSRVVVAGDSAGGNLAAAVCMALRAHDGPSLRGQMLVYPAVDAEMSFPSQDENSSGPFLSRADMAWFYDLYQPAGDRRDWRLSPLHSDDLSNLPPALVATAQLDPLRDEGEAYAQALAEAGTTAAAVRYRGVCHGFFGWSHAAEPSRQLMAQASSWLRAQLATPS